MVRPQALGQFVGIAAAEVKARPPPLAAAFILQTPARRGADVPIRRRDWQRDGPSAGPAGTVGEGVLCASGNHKDTSDTPS